MVKRSSTGWAPRVAMTAAVALAFTAPAFAQSLSIRTPTPLGPGENRGTLDNMVGPQFWSLKYRKGAGKVTVGFTSMGLFGNRQTTTIEVVLHAANGQVYQTRSLTSNGTVAQLEVPGNFLGPGLAIVELRPTGMALVRAGGDYTISVTGPGVDFAGAGAGGPRPEGIVGTYSVMICPPDFDCQNSLSIHFSADGTVRTTDGHSGVWKVFDPEALIYTVVVGRDRWSLKLIPGRGLANTSDVSTLVFQAVR